MLSINLQPFTFLTFLKCTWYYLPLLRVGQQSEAIIRKYGFRREGKYRKWKEYARTTVPSASCATRAKWPADGWGLVYETIWALGDQGRDWNALTRHLASKISVLDYASSASLVRNAADNSLACFQVLEQRYESSELSNGCVYAARELATGSDNWKIWLSTAKENTGSGRNTPEQR